MKDHYLTATNLQLLTPAFFIVAMLWGQWVEGRASARLSENERRTAEGAMAIPFGRWLLVGVLGLVLGQDALRYYAKNQLGLSFAIAAVILAISVAFAIYQLWCLGELGLPRTYVRTMRGVWLVLTTILLLILSNTIYLGWNERSNHSTASTQPSAQ